MIRKEPLVEIKLSVVGNELSVFSIELLEQSSPLVDLLELSMVGIDPLVVGIELSVV